MARKRLGQQKDYEGRRRFTVRHSLTGDGRQLTTLALKGITLFRSAPKILKKLVKLVRMNGIICKPVNNTAPGGWGEPYEQNPDGTPIYPGTAAGANPEKFFDYGNADLGDAGFAPPLYPLHSDVWLDEGYFSFPSFGAGDERIKGWGSKEWISEARRPDLKIYKLPWYEPTPEEVEGGGKVVLSFGKGGQSGRYNIDLSEVYVYYDGARLCGLHSSDSEGFVTGCWRSTYDDIVVAKIKLSVIDKKVSFYKRPFKPEGYEDFWGNTVYSEQADGIAPEHWEFMGEFVVQCYQPVYFNASGTKACTMGTQDIPRYELTDAPCAILFDIYQNSVVLRNYSEERGAWLDCELFAKMRWKRWTVEDLNQDLAESDFFVDDCSTSTCEYLWDAVKYWGNFFPDPCTEYYDTSAEACTVNIAYGHDGGGTCGVYTCQNVRSYYVGTCTTKTGLRDDTTNYNEGQFDLVNDAKIIVFMDYDKDTLVEAYFDIADLYRYQVNHIINMSYYLTQAQVNEEWKYIYRYSSGSNIACTPYETTEDCWRMRQKYYLYSDETTLNIEAPFKFTTSNGVNLVVCNDSYEDIYLDEDEEDNTNIADWTTADPDERCINYQCAGTTSPDIPADVPDTPTTTITDDETPWDYKHTQIGCADFRLGSFAYTEVTDDGVANAAIESVKDPSGTTSPLGDSPTYIFGATMHDWLYDVLELHATAPSYEWYEDLSSGGDTEYIMQFPIWLLWRGFFYSTRQQYGLARDRHDQWVMSARGSDGVTAASKSSDGNPLEKLTVENADGAWLSELGVI